MAPDPDAPWTGPSAGEMIRTHTLAHEIITRHDDPCPVFDGSELAYLQAYLANTATDNATRLLAEHKTTSPNADQNSLVAYIVGREVQGETLLDDNEKTALRQWFAEGKADERIQAWRRGDNV
jgi:hypothetical protein